MPSPVQAGDQKEVECGFFSPSAQVSCRSPDELLLYLLSLSIALTEVVIVYLLLLICIFYSLEIINYIGQS